MNKKIIIIFLAVIISFFKVGNVYALENDTILKREFIPNVWSFHYRNGKVWTYGQLNMKYLNGKLGYCIEPDSAVNTDVYSSYSDWSVSKYSDYVKRRMELISYYGYQYEGHQTIKYYMATQELIWVYSDDEYIKWTKEDNSLSEEININHEKNEIIRLVNLHDTLPSFTNLSYKSNVGDTLKLVDNNNVLQNYRIVTDEKYDVKENEFSMVVPNKKEVNIKFLYKGNNNLVTTVYACNIRSQRMATFGNPAIKESTITIIPDKIKLVVNKKDKESENNILDEGNIVKIKNLDKNEYIKIDEKEELNISSDGVLNIYLEKGKYELEEVKASKNYVVNNEKVSFNLDENTDLDNNEYKIDFYNQKVYGKIKIRKVNKHNDLLKGCTFEVYDENMILVDTIITTDNEYDDSIILPLGKYFVKETKTIDGYILDEKTYEVNLEYEDDKTPIIEERIEVINEKIKCDVMFLSLDEDNKSLKKVNVSVYNSDDKLVYKGTTNNKGSVKIENVTYGDYYLVETKVPNGYELNKDKVNFTIDDNCCLASLKLNNNKVDMPKTTTKNSDIGCLILFIISACLFKYVKKIN